MDLGNLTLLPMPGLEALDALERRLAQLGAASGERVAPLNIDEIRQLFGRYCNREQISPEQMDVLTHGLTALSIAARCALIDSVVETDLPDREEAMQRLRASQEPQPVEIPLGGLGGKYHAIIDQDDLERVMQHHWTVSRAQEGKIRVRGSKSKDGEISTLSTFLTGFARTNFLNGNSLDFRRSNMVESKGRVASQERQGQLKKNNTSGYVGVFFNRGEGKYQVQLQYRGKVYSGGYHLNAVDAAIAYDELAYKLYGAEAKLNFPNRHATRTEPRRKLY